MSRASTRSVEEQDRYRIERQRHFRLAADLLVARLARQPVVRKVALIGSVARPLWREVSRRVWTVHECKDLDLAVWVDSLDDLKRLRRDRIDASQELLKSANIGVPDHQIELFLLEPGSDRYLGRVCLSRECPAQKRNCETCSALPYLMRTEGFTFWPETVDPARSVVLFERGRGIVALAADLPSEVTDAVRLIDVTVRIPEHRRFELEVLAERWRDEAQA